MFYKFEQGYYTIEVNKGISCLNDEYVVDHNQVTRWKQYRF